MATAVGAVGLGSSLAGGVLSSVSALQQGQSTASMYNYRAGMARFNAQVDQQNSDYALNVGDKQAEIQGRKGAQVMGQIKASQSASGVDVNSGSSKDVQTSEKTVQLQDMNQIRANAAKTAYDYRAQGIYDTAQAGLYAEAASDAKSAGELKAAGSLISTAGSVSSKWMQGQQMGLWG